MHIYQFKYHHITVLETPSQCGTQVGIAGLQPVIIRGAKPQCHRDYLSSRYGADMKRRASMLEFAPADNLEVQIELPCVLSHGRQFESLPRPHAGTQRTSTQKKPQLESDSQCCCCCKVNRYRCSTVVDGESWLPLVQSRRKAAMFNLHESVFCVGCVPCVHEEALSFTHVLLQYYSSFTFSFLKVVSL